MDLERSNKKLKNNIVFSSLYQIEDSIGYGYYAYGLEDDEA